MKVYCAGRISKNDWRHDVCPQLRDYTGNIACNWDNGDWDIARWDGVPGLMGYHIYMGPVFVGCDHGCYHNECGHGAGAVDRELLRGATDEEMDAVYNCIYPGCIDIIHRMSVFQADRDQIACSDLLFAWIEDQECFGTIAEIGYAHGMNIPVVIATPKRPKREFARSENDGTLCYVPEDDPDPLKDLWFVFHFAEFVVEAESPAAGLSRALEIDKALL